MLMFLYFRLPFLPRALVHAVATLFLTDVRGIRHFFIVEEATGVIGVEVQAWELLILSLSIFLEEIRTTKRSSVAGDLTFLKATCSSRYE